MKFDSNGSWRDLELLFAQAIEIPASERAAWFDEHCSTTELRSELEALLAAHESSLLGESAAWSQAPLAELRDEPLWSAGAQLLDYRIERCIGRGATGVVYEAEQVGAGRRVALKFLKHTPRTRESLARLQREARVLGQLEHQGISRLYDFAAPLIDGRVRPFLAMELVSGGRTLRAWASERPRSIEARVEITARIADALHHGHMLGVIHRDVKPENVLVDRDGQPKLIDFGVAKVLDVELEPREQLTVEGLVVGTPSYMSPEQFEAASRGVGVASDVYSLGVVLYELLSGELPHDVRGSTLNEAARRIATVEPPPLARRVARCSPDLEQVVMKALSKAPEERYESAAAFAADLRRFLRSQPVLARAASWPHRARLFTRRNPLAAAGLATAALAVTLGVPLVAHFAFEQARSARAEATQRRIADETLEVTRRLLAHASPNERGGGDPRLSEWLAELSDRVERELVGRDPLVQASVRSVVGRLLFERGDFASAELHLRQAHAGLVLARGEAHPETLEAAIARGHVLVRLDRIEQAFELIERLRELRSAPKSGWSDARADLSVRLDSLWLAALEWSSELRAALEHYPPAIERAESAVGEGHAATLALRSAYAGALTRANRPSDALKQLDRVAELRNDALGEAHEDSLASLHALAQAHAQQGDSALALELHEREARIAAQAYGEGSIHVRRARHAIANALFALGRLDEGLDAALESHASFAAGLGEDHPDTLVVYGSLGVAYMDVGQLDVAEAVLRDAYARRPRVTGPRDAETIRILNNLISALLRAGEPHEAEPLARLLVAERIELLGADNAGTHLARLQLGKALLLQGRALEALEWTCEPCLRGSEIFGEKNPIGPYGCVTYGRALLSVGRAAEALGFLEAALAELERLQGAEHRWCAEVRSYIASARAALADRASSAAAERR